MSPWDDALIPMIDVEEFRTRPGPYFELWLARVCALNAALSDTLVDRFARLQCLMQLFYSQAQGQRVYFYGDDSLRSIDAQGSLVILETRRAIEQHCIALAMRRLVFHEIFALYVHF